MKGFINKGEHGWRVVSVVISDSVVGTVIRELQLHPDSVKEIQELSERFDNIEARILADPSVEFTIQEECLNYDGAHFGRDCGCREGFVQYAKLITVCEI